MRNEGAYANSFIGQGYSHQNKNLSICSSNRYLNDSEFTDKRLPVRISRNYDSIMNNGSFILKSQNICKPNELIVNRMHNESSLSVFTKERNVTISNEISKYKQKFDRDSTSVNDKEIVGDLLDNAKRELRCLSYKLSTVISDGNYHNHLEENLVTRVEIIEDTLIYCKVFCKHKFSPMTLKMSYDKRELLKLYVSSSNKMPNASDCDKEYIRPRYLRLWAPGRHKKFTKEYMYFTFCCSNPISLDVHVKFNTMEKALGKKKQEIVFDEFGNANKKTNILTPAQEAALNNISKSAERPKVVDGQNHVERNIKIAFKWKEINIHKIDEKKEEFHKKFQLVKMNHK